MIAKLSFLISLFSVLQAFHGPFGGGPPGPFQGPPGPFQGPVGPFQGPPGPFPGPSFLANVSSEAVREFFGILSNRTATRSDIKAAISAWAQRNNVSESVTEFEAKRKALDEERKANITAAINQLPTAFQELSAIAEDDSLSQESAFAAITSKFANYSDPLKRLLVAASFGAAPPGGSGHGGPHGGGGHFGGPNMGLGGGFGSRGGFGFPEGNRRRF